MEKTLRFHLFPSGNIICFDEKGNQVPELAHSLVEMLVEKAVDLGYKPENIKIESCGYLLKPYTTEEGEINWEVGS